MASFTIALALALTALTAPLDARDLFIARHGQTEWNRTGRTGGNPEINAQGYEDRVSLLLALREFELDAIFTSALRRTQLTAALVADARKLTPVADADLDEMRAGVLEGICRSTLGADKLSEAEKSCRDGSVDPSSPLVAFLRSEYARRDVDKWNYRPAGGESYGDGLLRVDRFYGRNRELLRTRRALIVAHGGTNRLLLARAMGWPAEQSVRIQQNNNWIYRVQRGPRGPQLSLYRDGAWRPCTGLPDVRLGLECAR